MFVATFRVSAEIHFKELPVSQLVQILVRLEKVLPPRRLRASFSVLRSPINLIDFIGKPRRDGEKNLMLTRSNFKTRTTNTGCSPERLTRRMMKRRIRFTSWWTRTWMRGGELEGA